GVGFGFSLDVLEVCLLLCQGGENLSHPLPFAPAAWDPPGGGLSAPPPENPASPLGLKSHSLRQVRCWQTCAHQSACLMSTVPACCPTAAKMLLPRGQAYTSARRPGII